METKEVTLQNSEPIDILESQGHCCGHTHSESLTPIEPDIPLSLDKPQSQKISFEGKNKVFLEGIGQGGQSGLEKINEMMAMELNTANQMQKLFQYIQNIQNVKNEYKVENISKIVRNFPSEEILDIFVHRFRVFHDLPKHITKVVLTELTPIEYKFREKIFEGEGIYLICDGEVIQIKNEKMYLKYLAVEEKFAKEREFKSKVS